MADKRRHLLDPLIGNAEEANFDLFSFGLDRSGVGEAFKMTIAQLKTKLLAWIQTQPLALASTLTVALAAVFNGSATYNGAATFNSSVNFNNAAVFSSTFDVDGIATFTNIVDFFNDVTLSGTSVLSIITGSSINVEAGADLLREDDAGTNNSVPRLVQVLTAINDAITALKGGVNFWTSYNTFQGSTYFEGLVEFENLVAFWLDVDLNADTRLGAGAILSAGAGTSINVEAGADITREEAGTSDNSLVRNKELNDEIFNRINEDNKRGKDVNNKEWAVLDALKNVAFSVGDYGTKSKYYNIADENGEIVATLNEALLLKLIDISKMQLLREDDGDEFGIADGQKNLILKANKDGLFVNNINDIKNIISKIGDEFGIADGQKNLILKVNKDGLFVNNIYDKDGNELGSGGSGSGFINQLDGKNFVSFGNSLCNGTWEAFLASLSGGLFDTDINDISSAGGSFTGFVLPESVIASDAARGGQYRAVKLVEYCIANDFEPEFLFFENVHDSFKGTIEESPSFFYSQNLLFTGSQFYSHSEAAAYWTANFASILSSTVGVNMVGTTISLELLTVAKLVEILTAPTASGNITVTIGSNSVNVAITAGMSIDEVLNEILVTDFSIYGWSASKSGTSLKMTYLGTAGSDTDVLSITDTDSTGITTGAETSTQSSSYRSYGFKSRDISYFNDSAYWSYLVNSSYGSENACYPYWKGLIEYLQENLPNTKMYMLLFPNHGITMADYQREDGTFDIDLWKQSAKYLQNMNNRDGLSEVAKYYNIPVIDVEREMSISPYNWLTYFNQNDVHPKTAGYQAFANVIFEKLC